MTNDKGQMTLTGTLREAALRASTWGKPPLERAGSQMTNDKGLYAATNSRN